MNAIEAKGVKLWILFLSQIRDELKTPFDFWARYFWVFLFCLSYRFFFKMNIWSHTLSFGGHQIDLPLFIVSGTAVARLLYFSMNICEETIQNLKTSSVLDWLLITPTTIWELYFTKWLWKVFVGLTDFIAIILFSKFLIGTPFKPFIQGPIFIAILLMIFAYAGIGATIAAFGLLTRRGNSLRTVVGEISIALGGVIFPIQLLPKELKFIANLLPITHGINIVRNALVSVAEPTPMTPFVLLTVMALGFSLLGFFAVETGLAMARRHGPLS